MNFPIGFIDSGVGGASILKAVEKLLPYENFVFFADTLHAPYGNKKKRILLKIILNNVKYLVEKRNIKLLVVACNTATAVAKEEILKNFPFLPCVFVEPPLKPAVEDKNKKILVLATKRTIENNSIIKHYKNISKACNFAVETLYISNLATLIDNQNNVEINKVLKENIKENFDAIVLGCTHYNFIKNNIAKLFPNLKIYSCENAVAKRVVYLIETNKLTSNFNRGEIEIITNSQNIAVTRRMMFMFPKHISSIWWAIAWLTVIIHVIFWARKSRARCIARKWP